MNINELITDEDIETEDDLALVEQDTPMEIPLRKDIDALFETLESLKAKRELLTYIQNKSFVNKKLAREMHSIFDNIPERTLSVEMYTDTDTKVNFGDTIVFMDNNINKSANNSVSVLKEIFDKGVEQCDDYYEWYMTKHAPAIADAYNDLYARLSLCPKVGKDYSLLFMDPATDSFVDISDVPFTEIMGADFQLNDIPDDPDQLSFGAFKVCVADIQELFGKNPDLLKLIKMIGDTPKVIPITDIMNAEVFESDISLKDLFKIFMGGKGLWYFSNMDTLLTFVINTVSMQRHDYAEIASREGALSNFIFSIEEEIKQIKATLSFMNNFVSGILPFFDLMDKLFFSVLKMKPE